MIGNWREDFGKQFPFYYVQIAPYTYTGKEQKANLLREQQVKAMEMTNTGMVVISDLVDLPARHLEPDEIEHAEDAHHQKQETGKEDLDVVEAPVGKKGQNQGKEVQDQGLINKGGG